MNTDTDLPVPTVPPATPAPAAIGASPGVACPRCGGGPLTPQSAPEVSCPGCGHLAAREYVAEARWLLEQDGRLHARLDWVLAQVAAGRPAPASPRAVPAAAVRSGHSAGARNLLLGAGALMLVVAAAVFTAVVWDLLGAGGQITALAVLVAVLAAAAHGLRARFRATAEALASVAAAVAAIAALAAPDLGLGADWMTSHPARWAAAAMALAALLSAAGAALSQLVAWHAGFVVAAGAGLLAAAFGWARDDVPGPLAVTVLAVVGAGLCVTPVPDHRLGRDVRVIGRIAGALAALLATAAYGDLDRHLLWAGAWAVIAVAAAASLAGRPRARRSADRAPQDVAAQAARGPAALVVGVAAGQVLPLAVFHRPAPLTAVVMALAVIGGLVLALATLRRAAPVAAPAGITLWIVALALLAATTRGASQQQVAWYLGVVALLLFGAAIAPAAGPLLPAARTWMVPRAARWPLAWAGAAAGATAAWLTADLRSATLLEAYTLPAAALLLAAGAATRWLRGRGGSMLVLGPALSTAVGPAAALALDQSLGNEPAWRAVTVIAVGTALAVGGAAGRWQAPLFVGTAAATVTAVGQLAGLADLIPRWVSLGAAGALLITAGLTFEALFRIGRHAWSTARTLR